MIRDFDFVDAARGWLVETSEIYGSEGKAIDRSVLLRTGDGGLTWDLTYELTVEILDIDFLSTSQGWMTTVGELLQSVDGGKTWQGVATDGMRPRDEIDFVDAWHGWGYGPEIGSIVTTTDGGITWRESPTPCTFYQADHAFSFIDPTTGWIVCQHQPGAGSQPKQLFQTSDGGLSWKLLAESVPPGSTPPPPEAPLPQLSIGGYVNDLTFIDSIHGWLSLARAPVLLFTADGGQSWSFTPLQTCDGQLCHLEGALSAEFVSPTEGFWLNWAGNAALYASKDGGLTSTLLYAPTQQ